MKKLLVFAVMMLMSTAASWAQFGFSAIDKVEKVGNEFRAYAGNGSYATVPANMAETLKAYDCYYLLSIDDKQLVAAGDEFVVEKLEVENVALNDGKPEVFFTNGSSKVFTKPDWAKVKKGSTIRRVYVNTSTREFENFRLVNENTVVVYHDKISPMKKDPALLPSAPETKTKQEKKQEMSVNDMIDNLKFSITRH